MQVICVSGLFLDMETYYGIQSFNVYSLFQIRSICKHILAKVTLLKTVLTNCLKKDFSLARTSELIVSINDVRKIIETIVKNSERQVQLKILSKHQAKLYKLFKGLSLNLKSSAVLHSNQRFILWDFPDTFSYNENSRTFSFENESEVCLILDLCGSIEKIVNSFLDSNFPFQLKYFVEPSNKSNNF